MRTTIIILAVIVLGLLMIAGFLVVAVFKPVAVTAPPLPALPPTATLSPTPTSTLTSTPSPTWTLVPPSACPTATPSAQPTEFCDKHGQVVWEIEDKGVEQKITFGSLTESCWIAGWVKTTFPKPKIWLFAIPPKTNLAFQGFQAGKAWFIGGNRETVGEFLDQLASTFPKDCGEKGLEVQKVYFPDSCNFFPLLVHYQSRWTVDS